MTRLSVTEARFAALFMSGLQRSDAPTGDVVARAVSRTVRRYGARSCVGLMAQEFGDHPEAATDRMRWIRQLAAEIPARPATVARPPSAFGAPLDHLSATAHPDPLGAAAGRRPTHLRYAR